MPFAGCRKRGSKPPGPPATTSSKRPISARLSRRRFASASPSWRSFQTPASGCLAPKTCTSAACSSIASSTPSSSRGSRDEIVVVAVHHQRRPTRLLEAAPRQRAALVPALVQLAAFVFGLGS